MSVQKINSDTYVGDTGKQLKDIKTNSDNIKTNTDNINNLKNDKQDKLYDSGYKPMDSFGTYFTEYGNGYREVRVRKIGNVCYLKGLINVSQDRNNTEDNVCIIPSGFRPSSRIYVPAASSSGEVSKGGHPCLLTIRPSGNICLHNSYCAGWLSLDGISYIQD